MRCLLPGICSIVATALTMIFPFPVAYASLIPVFRLWCRPSEIRTLDYFHKLIKSNIRIVYYFNNTVDNFNQIVRRYVGCHATAIPEERSPTDSKSWRQYHRLHVMLIKVRFEINGVFVNVLSISMEILDSLASVYLMAAGGSRQLNQNCRDRQSEYTSTRNFVPCAPDCHKPRHLRGDGIYPKLHRRLCTFSICLVRCKPKTVHCVKYSSVNRFKTILTSGRHGPRLHSWRNQ